ncbi:MAG TPA: methylated-DNA--[protein]-cysteine S-methyltransferase [Tepidisphaeraceae bacterium]|nr:methylated-DNA--[protein]-cysteine S-methyltransferase [Tepidisphaeraceae bacterium]
MQKLAYCIFDTALGACGIGWTSERSVTHFQLPEATIERTASRVARLTAATSPSAAPPEVADVIDRVRAHLSGEPQDFDLVPVELNGVSDFERQVYRVTREIAAGRTMTYGEIARAVNHSGAARVVGQALGRNPIPLIIPCHRVLAAGGKSGGFSAPGGRATKAKLLALEGVLLPF